MENKNIIIIIFVLLGLVSIELFQYLKIFDFVSAYDASKPAVGHNWGEMQCTEDMCIKTDSHKIGIGTDSPTEKLEVSGKIIADDVCTHSICLSAIVGSGICGTANGQTVSSAPSVGLCIIGDPSAIGGGSLGPWTWTCTGATGTPTSCSTSRELYLGAHTPAQCTGLSGTIIGDGTGKNMCKLSGHACPSG